MRTIKQLSILIITCLAVSGCANQQKAPAQKTSPEAKPVAKMNYDIMEMDSFTVMGIVTRVKTTADNSEKYSELWKKFESYSAQVKPLSSNQKYYGVSLGTKNKDVTEYLAGMKVGPDAKSTDKNLVIRQVPAARYAVFKCPGKDIGQTMQYIFTQWLPSARYKLDTNACSFELYPPDDWTTRTVAIYIPVSNK